ncbi:MAG: hypothetical protein ABTQ73_03240 [Caldilineales bacterium]
MNTRRIVTLYGVATLFCIAFNAVYLRFGHGVSSPFMTYAFVFSLVLGILGFSMLGWLRLESRVAFNLYNAGIVTLTVGSLLRGVLDIAGADAPYPTYYFVVGALLVLAGGAWYGYQALQAAGR